MCYIALPDRFSSDGNKALSFIIAEMDSNGQQPVGMMIDYDCPINLQKLAENFVSVLNGKDPLHMIKSDFEMYYEPHINGFNMRFRDKNDGGVTRIGASFVKQSDVEMALNA